MKVTGLHPVRLGRGVGGDGFGEGAGAEGLLGRRSGSGGRQEGLGCRGTGLRVWERGRRGQSDRFGGGWKERGVCGGGRWERDGFLSGVKAWRRELRIGTKGHIGGE